MQSSRAFAAAAAKAREDCIETIGQGVKHESAQVSRAAARAPLATTNAYASAEQRRHELHRIERHEVRWSLTDPDELDRQSELRSDRENHATFGRAIELGENDARHADRLGELTCLDYTVLAGRGIEHEEHLRSEERRVGKECRSRWSPYP